MNDSRLMIVAYDIRSPRRLARVARRLEARGERLQRSVFLLSLSPLGVETVMTELRGLIDEEADDVRFYAAPRSPVGAWIGRLPGLDGATVFGGLTDQFLSALRSPP